MSSKCGRTTTRGTKCKKNKNSCIYHSKKEISSEDDESVSSSSESNKVMVKTPTKVMVKTPTKVMVKTPTKVMVKTPTKVMVKTPTKVMVKTPTKVMVKTPTTKEEYLNQWLSENGYTVKEKGKSGGVAITYIACVKDNCNYILKVVDNDTNKYNAKDIINNFKKETEVAKLMGENDIGPKVYEFIIKQFQNIIMSVVVMEKYEMDLDEMTIAKKLTKIQAENIIKQLENKVNRMHEMGYAHCDLKMANIVVNNISSDDPRIALIDFGFTMHETEESVFSETIFRFYTKDVDYNTGFHLMPWYYEVYNINKANGIEDSAYVGSDFETNVRSDLYAIEGIKLYIKEYTE